MIFDTKYLKRLARIETPEPTGRLSFDVKCGDPDTEKGLCINYTDLCEGYYLLRDTAKKLLRNPEDKKIEKTLSKLVTKLNLGTI